MLGLKYVGNREEGISILLYRSYKTVSITPRQPYKFTARDNTSLEARHYYEDLRNLGIAIIASPADSGKSSDSTTRTQKLEAETDAQVDVQTPIPSEEDKLTAEPEVVTEVPQTEVTDADQSAELESADSSLVAEMSDAELSEYLEMNYNKDQLKTLISDLGVDITVGRKSESTVISDLVNNHKAAVVAHLAKK